VIGVKLEPRPLSCSVNALTTTHRLSRAVTSSATRPWSKFADLWFRLAVIAPIQFFKKVHSTLSRKKQHLHLATKSSTKILTFAQNNNESFPNEMYVAKFNNLCGLRPFIKSSVTAKVAHYLTKNQNLSLKLILWNWSTDDQASSVCKLSNRRLDYS